MAVDVKGPPANVPEVLIPEARRRQRRRQGWVAAVATAMLILAGLGVWLSQRGTPPPRSVSHKTSPLRRPPPVVSASPPELNRPTALALDANGDLLIANQGTNQILRRLPNGVLQVVAGTGVAGYSGDGGPAVRAELNTPNGLAVAPSGTIYVADTFNNRVRAISRSGIISTVAGDGQSVINYHPGIGPFGRPAVDAALTDPNSIAIDPHGQLYIASGAIGIQVVRPGHIDESGSVRRQERSGQQPRHLRTQRNRAR